MFQVVQLTTTELNASRYFDMDCFRIRHVALCWIFQASIGIQPCCRRSTLFIRIWIIGPGRCDCNVKSVISERVCYEYFSWNRSLVNGIEHVDGKSALVYLMASFHQARSRYHSQWWLRSMCQIYMTPLGHNQLKRPVNAWCTCLIMRSRISGCVLVWIGWQWWAMGLLPDTWNCRVPGMRGTFFPPPTSKQTASYRSRHASQVSWCMSRSLTRLGWKNVPGIPGACATHSFTHLAREAHGIINDAVTFHGITPGVITVSVSRPLFTMWKDILPPNLAKSRSRDMWVRYGIALKFHGFFQSDEIILSSNLAASWLR